LFCYTFVSVDSKWLRRGWKIVRKRPFEAQGKWAEGGDIGERETPFEAQGKRERITRNGLWQGPDRAPEKFGASGAGEETEPKMSFKYQRRGYHSD
jgi:hypothetical protein